MALILYLLFLLPNNDAQTFTMTTPVPYYYKHFRTLTTEHFDIHYPSRSKENFFIPSNMKNIAEKTAVYLEEAFGILTKDLNSTPYLRIQVTLIDNTDSHNGFATPIPQNMIYIYVTPPLAHTSVAEYDNWLRETAFHELTHIINLSTTRGYSGVLRIMFGTVVNINGLSPLNIIEGLAVFEETNMSAKGRGRSTFLHTMLRTTEYEKTLSTESLYNLSQAPYMIDEWPLGNRPYLYGYLLFEHMAKNYGMETPGKISKHNAGVVPYYPSYSFEQFSKKDIPRLWNDMIEQKKKFYSEWINNIEKSKVTVVEKVPESNEHDFINSIPSLSPDGKHLAYHSLSGDKKESIVILDTTTFKQVHSVETDDPSFIKWLDNETILYNDLTNRVGSKYYELNTYNINSWKWSYKVLKNSSRITYADVISSNKLCTIRSGTGLSTINIENITGSRVNVSKTLYTSELLARLAKSACRVAGTGYEIYFIEKKVNQPETIIKLDSKGKKVELYTTKGSIKDLSVYQHYLTFIDDSDGVFNIYRMDLGTHKYSKITNLISGAFDVNNIDADNYYITYYTSEGFRIGKVAVPNVPKTKPEEKKAFIIQNLPIRDLPEFKLDSEPEKGKYHAFKTLIPKFWFPEFAFVDSGYLVGGMTYGADALFRHQYSVSAAYDSRTKRAVYGLSYTNQSFYPITSFSVYNDNTYSYNSSDRIIQDTMSNVDIAIPLNISWSALTGLTYDYRKWNAGLDRTKRFGAYIGIGFDETAATISTISSAERGIAGFARFNVYPKWMDSTYYSYQADSNIRFFIPLWWKHHVLAVNNDIAYTYGDPNMFFTAGGENSSLIFGHRRFLLRGYPVGYFATYSIAVTNIEYRFPILTINDGHNMFPLFIRKISGALITDNGFMGQDFKQDFHSFGAELRTSANIFYYIPVTLRLGLYKATNYSKGQFFVGVSSVF